MPLNGDYDKPKLIASTSHGSGAGIWIHKWPTYKPVALLLGHEDAVTGLSTAKGLPDWVLSSSYDGKPLSTLQKTKVINNKLLFLRRAP